MSSRRVPTSIHPQTYPPKRSRCRASTSTAIHAYTSKEVTHPGSNCESANRSCSPSCIPIDNTQARVTDADDEPLVDNRPSRRRMLRASVQCSPFLPPSSLNNSYQPSIDQPPPCSRFDAPHASTAERSDVEGKIPTATPRRPVKGKGNGKEVRSSTPENPCGDRRGAIAGGEDTGEDVQERLLIEGTDHA